MWTRPFPLLGTVCANNHGEITGAITPGSCEALTRAGAIIMHAVSPFLWDQAFPSFLQFYCSSYLKTLIQLFLSPVGPVSGMASILHLYHVQYLTRSLLALTSLSWVRHTHSPQVCSWRFFIPSLARSQLGSRTPRF